MGKRISHCQGKGSLAHNNRTFTPKNVDPERMKDNIVLVQQPIAEAYEECFGQAVQEYNAKQTRNDRKVDENYFRHLFNRDACNVVCTGANKQKSFYEDLIQIGTMEDTGIGTQDAEVAKECLLEYFEGFRKRNPNLHVFNAVLHMDEATPHLHIDHIPLGHYKRGLSVQNGLAQALKEMGFGSGKDAISKWRVSEREVFEDICRNHGIEVEAPQKARGYSYSVEEYKTMKEQVKEAQKELEDVQEQISACEENVSLLQNDKMILEKEISVLQISKASMEQELPVLKERISDVESSYELLQEAVSELSAEAEEEYGIDNIDKKIEEIRVRTEEKARVSRLEKLVRAFEKFIRTVPGVKELWEKFQRQELTRNNDRVK